MLKKHLLLILLFFILNFFLSGKDSVSDYIKIENLRIFKISSMISKYENKKVSINARFHSIGTFGDIINIRTEDGFLRFIFDEGNEKIVNKILNLEKERYYTFYGVIKNDPMYDWTLYIEDIEWNNYKIRGLSNI